MYASDMLKNRRGMKPAMPEKPKEGGANQAENRSFYLSEDEQKQMAMNASGEEMQLTVSGRMDKDGCFNVTSISPMGMGSESDGGEEEGE